MTKVGAPVSNLVGATSGGYITVPSPTASYFLRRNALDTAYEWAAASGSPWSEEAATASVTVNNSSTLVDITGLRFAMEANKSYIWECRIVGYHSSTADIRLGANVPTGGASCITDAGLDETTKSYTEWGTYSCRSGINMQWFGGFAVNGANAGDLQITFAQNTPTVFDSIVYKGSIIRYREVITT